MHRGGGAHDGTRDPEPFDLARGEPATRAALLAETGVTLLQVSVQEWLDRDDDRLLADIVTSTLTALRSVLGSDGAASSGS